MILSQAIHWAAQELNTASSTPRLDAEVLLAHVLQHSRTYLITEEQRVLTANELSLYRQCIAQRQQSKPVAYITQQKEFWSLNLHITAATLIPRPETELLVELILKFFPEDKVPRRIADLGTGSGAIALALANEHPCWEIHATDISADALAVASENAKGLGLTSIHFHQGEWCAALPLVKFDAIVSNPPYLTEKEGQFCAKEVSFEPISALVSGTDGLTDIRKIAKQAKKCLSSKGYLLLEHGSSQAVKVQEILQNEYYTAIESYRDLAAIERVTVGKAS